MGKIAQPLRANSHPVHSRTSKYREFTSLTLVPYVPVLKDSSRIRTNRRFVLNLPNPSPALPAVLILDREPGVSGLLCKAFRRHGLDAQTASDALVALALMQQQKFDLFIID